MVLKRGLEVKKATHVPLDTPMVQLIDNVPRHIDMQLTKIEDRIYRYKDTCLYLCLGQPNTSHS